MKQIIHLLLIGLFAYSCNNTSTKDLTPKVIESYSDLWKFHSGEGVDSLWMNSNYNDSGWKDVSSAKLLQDQGVTLDNGFGWYRKTVQFSDSMKKAIPLKGAIVLHLGKMASCEEVYFNGKLIGKTGDFPPNYTGYMDHNRNYLVTAENINLKGDNLIAIKFNEGWGIGGFLENAILKISSAETKDKLLCNVDVADTDYIFMSPDPIKVTANIENKNNWDIEGTLIVTFATDTFQSVKTDSLNIQIKKNSTYSRVCELDSPTPGFYRYRVQFKYNGEVACDKKLNIGFDPERIQSPIDANADFKEFWDNNLKELAKVTPNYKLTLLSEESTADYELYLVEMRSFENELIKAYYSKPKREGKHPVIVEYMGYNSPPHFPNRTWDGFAHFLPSIRGQALNKPANRFGTWITYGLKSKESYYYRGAFLDVVRALDFICSRPEIDTDRIAVKGGSQGGALSFVAAALDKRVKVAAPSIPFLSDYPDYFKIASWPKSDFDDYMKEHPEAKWEDVYNVLSYFDIKNLAQWIKCPLYMGFGVQDEVCPPHINFAAYNQVKNEKKWLACPNCGHSFNKEYSDTSFDFIKEKLGVR